MSRVKHMKESRQPTNMNELWHHINESWHTLQVCHDTFLWGAMAHSYLWYDVTPSDVRRNSFTCVTWLIYLLSLVKMDGSPILVAKCRFFSVFRAPSFVSESSCHSTFWNVRSWGRTRSWSRSYTYYRSIHHIYTHARARVCAHSHTHTHTHTHAHTPNLQ